MIETPTDVCHSITDDNYEKRTIDFSLVSLYESSIRSKRRRRCHMPRSLHFADDDFVTGVLLPSKPLQTTYHVENFTNLVDKDELWVQPHETYQNIMSIREHCAQFQEQQSSFQAYSDAIQTSFLRCCDETQNDNKHYCYYSNNASIAMYHEGTTIRYNDSSFNCGVLGLQRGLESYCVTNLSRTRTSVRKNMIQAIVVLDHLLRYHLNRGDLLSSVACPLTLPSKRFAHMMGIVDMMNAAASTSCDTTTTGVTIDTVPTFSLVSLNSVAA